MYVDTTLRAVSNSIAMSIQGQPYFANSVGNTGMEDFVQLDETTLAVTASGLRSDADLQPKPGTITIGTWGNVDVGLGYSRGSVVWIGTTQVALNGDNLPYDGNVGNPTTNLHGWIKPASVAGTDDATWVDSDMLQVKTRLPSDNDKSNTMVINGQ